MERRVFEKITSKHSKNGKGKIENLNNSKTLIDLRSPPSNHLETMQDYRKGDKSIKINDQWRIVFTWTDGDCHEVEIIDYH
jgi:proteic killer suppression protein